MTTLRPQPRFPEPDSQPFWDATKEHKLMYQTCNSCQEVIFFPRHHCTNCGSQDTSWHESKGDGTVYTFSVIVQSRHPAFRDLGAFSVAYIDLDEGFRMMSTVVGVNDQMKDISCGMRVRVRWEDQGEGGVSLPMFEPA